MVSWHIDIRDTTQICTNFILVINNKRYTYIVVNLVFIAIQYEK